MRTLISRGWAAWQEIAIAIGDFQARLLLSVFYFSIAAPFGLITRLLADPLRLRRHAASNWAKRRPPDSDLPSARHQY